MQTAMSFTLLPLQQAHVAVSTLALLFYFPVMLIGMQLYSDPENLKLRALHKRVALTALCLRTLGFALMFSMLK